MQAKCREDCECTAQESNGRKEFCNELKRSLSSLPDCLIQVGSPVATDVGEFDTYNEGDGAKDRCD